MAGTSKWIVASSMGVVEALKDQGYSRWNYSIRQVNQRARNNLRSYYQAEKISTSQSPAAAAASALAPNKVRDEKLKQSEDSLRTVMYLSCWGPN